MEKNIIIGVIVLLITCCINLIVFKRLIKYNYKETQAIIDKKTCTENQTIKCKCNKKFQLNVCEYELSYIVNNAKYTQHICSYNNYVNDKVTIYYNEDNPEDIVFDIALISSVFKVILIVVIELIIIGLIVLYIRNPDIIVVNVPHFLQPAPQPTAKPLYKNVSGDV